jgi:hypothetical protein
VSERHRDESKLGLIRDQVADVRARRNSLALQHWFYCTVAGLVCAGALVMIAALKLGPLRFLAATVVVAIGLIVVLVRVARSALRMSSNTLHAARLADQKAQLKGRLLTVITMAAARRRPALWDYLVEDTLARRDEFTPSKIERRRIPPSIAAFLGACAIALLMLPHLPLQGSAALRNNGQPSQVTADINNLVIRPADPALQPNARVFANAETLRELQQKLAAAERAQHGANGAFSKFMDKARNFADAFQDKLTGRGNPPPLDMRLTDNRPQGASGAPSSSNGNSDNGSNSSANSNQNSGSNGNGASRNGALPPLDNVSPNQADQLARNGAAMPGFQAQPGDQNSTGNPAQSASHTNEGAAGGSSHGSGSDPASLFGKPTAPPLGSDSFKIAIDAQPSDESSSPGAPAYIPPKIRVPLNSTQYPDEPLARTAVPASDQLTIKRVFER